MKETVRKFRSAHLGNERNLWILAPARKSPSCNLILFLDGELYRDRLGAAAIVQGLASRAEIGHSLCVFVSHASMEARWKECPCHPPFASFILDELLPWLEKKYPAIRSGRERILAGLSYTGLAAAYVATRTGASFTKVIAQSGSFWSDGCRLIAELKMRRAHLPVEFYLDVGRHETAENVRHKEDVLQIVSQIYAIRRLRDTLLEKGSQVRYVEFEGGHDFAGWKRTLPGALKWALAPHAKGRPQTVIVNDRMQRGYRYERVEPAGKNFDPEFTPDLTPPEMLELGVFGGKYLTDCAREFPKAWFAKAKLCPERHDPKLNFFGINASQPLAVWQAKGWIGPQDPRGWFQWYCRYYLGRRMPEEDRRQIKRWKAIRRHIAQIAKHCRPGDLACRRRQRQAVLHWAYDARKI